MKKVIIPLTLLFSMPIIAQDDEPKRPSWSEDLPERQEQPELDLDTPEPDNDFGLSRDDLFADDRPSSVQNEDNSAAQAQAAADDAARAAAEEEARKAEEEAARLAAEQAAQEEAARLAAEQAAEEETARLAAEQAAEEEAARRAQEQAAQQAAAEESARQAAEQEAAEEAARQAANEEAARIAAEQAAANSASEAVDTSGYPWNILEKVAAEYPASAIRSNREGWVEVELTLEPNGTVSNTEMIETYRNYRGFVKPALEAVKLWRYEPPSNYGINIPIKKRVRVEFKLR